MIETIIYKTFEIFGKIYIDLNNFYTFLHTKREYLGPTLILINDAMFKFPMYSEVMMRMRFTFKFGDKKYILKFHKGC